MNFSKLMKLAVLGSAFMTMSSQATLVTKTFDNGDSLADFSVDRAAPAGFQIINNELVMSIDGSTFGTGPSAFYDTQGMKIDTTGSNFVSVDMYIDSAWSNSERFAGMWGVGKNNANDISSYPILEFQGPGVTDPSAGLAIWDNAWVDLSTLFNLDEFNTIAYKAANNGVQYFVNGTMVYSETASGTSSFGDIILNAKNDGNSFDVRYDNLTYGVVSEPGAIALLGLGMFAMGLRRRKS
ncbi:PEP-CTERM sorting domain-containing protein [Aliiglaciecola lipolytica]|uniref:PEP-CTERM sorting domain-containing protein n=1 Tax=Aliiglaciecola lipolytica TaxID=477689 RepID=UPI001C0881C7|nr:PEP-CTERM sorting domain-containing protein [Aliiglaciecola lipolytica]MBU2876840.1 PEP-CTERM sorting domain-containing protein [Aliiglaciecola lipolytica]